MKKTNEHSLTYQSISTKREIKKKVNKKTYNPFKKPKIILGRVEIVAPPVLSFFGRHYSTFMDFISDINKHINSKRKILINFRNVEDIKGSALIILYANIEQAQKKLSSKSIIKTTPCQTRFVSIIFEKFGIWRLTNEDGRRPSYPDTPGLELEVCTASVNNNKDSEIGRDQLRKIIYYTKRSLNLSECDDDNDRAFAAITESVSNVGQHAYDNIFFNEHFEGFLKNWWIIVHEIDDQLFISVYDMGAGIPNTLHNKPGIQDLIAYVAKLVNVSVRTLGDGAKIKAAVEYGKSRFNINNRGKGLSDAKDFVANNPEGELIIYSGFGSYTYRSADNKEEVEDLKSHFQGTLLQWNLKLGKNDE